MVKLFLFCVIAISVFFNACHNTNTEHATANHTLVADSLLSVANQMRDTDIDKALVYANLAMVKYCESSDSVGILRTNLTIGIIESIKGQKEEALSRLERVNHADLTDDHYHIKCETLLEIGKLYYDWGQYDSSLVYFANAQQLASENMDSVRQAEAIFQLGKYYHTTGQYNQSMAHYQKSMAFIDSASQIGLNVSLLLSIGKRFLNQGLTKEALANYQRAYALSINQPNKLTKAEACNHLGSIYLELNQPSVSIEYHNLALNLRQQMLNANGLVKSHNNIGETYVAMGQTDSALVHFNQALEISSRLHYLKGTVKALNNIATCYSGTTHFNDALAALNKALGLAVKSGYKEGIAEAYCSLGWLYQSKGKSLNAIMHFEKALALAADVRRIDVVAKCYDGICLAYKQQGDFAKALDAREKASTLQLAQLETQKTNQLAEMQILFESEQKERENQLLKQQNKLNTIIIQRKNNFLAVSLVALAFLMVIVLLVYARFKNKKRSHFAMQTLNAQLELAIGERDKLLSIIAHELRNPLFWFQNLTQTLSQKFRSMPDDKIEKSLLSLDESAKNAFHLMDNLLNWSRSKLNRISPKRVPVELQKVVGQNLRLFQSITVYKRIQLVSNGNDGVLVLVDIDLLDTVLRNLVSNAIKFTPDDGIISIDYRVVDGFVRLEIADSGQGLSPQLQHAFRNNQAITVGQGLLNEKGSGFGLRICHEFIELIGGRLGIADSKHGGACFWITVPLADKPMTSKSLQTLSYSN